MLSYSYRRRLCQDKSNIQSCQIATIQIGGISASKYLGAWHTYDYCGCAKVKYEKPALQEGLQEDLELPAVPWGHPKAVGVAPVLAGATHAHPATDDKKQNAKATQMPGAAEQMLEMRNRAHDGKVPEVLRTWSLTQALWSWTNLLAPRGFWSSPPLPPHMHNTFIHLSMCFGGSGKRWLLFCHICFQFFSPFQRYGLTAVNRHWPLPCGKDIVLLSLDKCGSSGHKLSRAPLCQRHKEWYPPKAGKRHQLRWQKWQQDASRPEKELTSFLDKRDSNSDQLLLLGEKQPENLALCYYYFEGLPYNMIYDITKSKTVFFFRKRSCQLI